MYLPLILAQHRVTFQRSKTVLTCLLLALAIEMPAWAQTISAGDDGTVLKEIIIFGRHSIRAPTSSYDGTNGLNEFAATAYPQFVDTNAGVVTVGYLTLRGKTAATLLGAYFREYLRYDGPPKPSTSCAI